MWGSPGQITGVFIYKADQAKRGYPTGHFVNAVMLFLVSILSLCLLFYYRYVNSQITKKGGEGVAAVRYFRY
jgi:hypothetical protein